MIKAFRGEYRFHQIMVVPHYSTGDSVLSSTIEIYFHSGSKRYPRSDNQGERERWEVFTAFYSTIHADPKLRR